MLLLTSSLTSVYAIYHMKNFQFGKMQFWFGVTVLLGLAFLILEIYEFNHYMHEFEFKLTSSALGLAFLHASRNTRFDTLPLGFSWDHNADDSKCKTRIKLIQRS